MIRVLIVKISSMGDILHTLPALTDALLAKKEIQFDWIVEENFAQIPSWHPAVNRVIPIALRRWKKSWFQSQIRTEREQFRRDMSACEYDLIIDAQGLLKTAIPITWRARGIRHGYNFTSAREPISALFYQKRYSVDKNLHAVERIRQLFALSLQYRLPSTIGDYAIAAHFRQSTSLPHSPYLVFLHSTTRDKKHWPEHHWRGLIELLEKSDFTIKLPWGTEAEYQRALRLAQSYSHVDVLPKFTLSEMASIIAGAQALISVDTGLSHLAAALDKPNITLYGPTDPGLIGGYGQNQIALKSPTLNLQDIDADTVFSMVKPWLS